jgi:magnesium transporter
VELTWVDVERVLGKDDYLTVLEDFEETIHQTQYYSLKEGHVFIMRHLTFIEHQLQYVTEYFLKVKGLHWRYENGSFKMVCENDDKFLELIYERFEKNKNIALLYNGEVDQLEDNLYGRKLSNAFMDTWFDLKKDLARIERFLSRQIFAMKDFLKAYEHDPSFPTLDYTNFTNDINFLLNTTQGILGRLDNLHNYYSSIKNDRLNRNIYFLTLLSGIFLPLNLIVGFFGMNTEGLFFKDNPLGTMNVVYILGGILVTFVLGFNIFKIIDRLFLRWWLGKMNFYQKFAKKAEELQEKWSY